MGHFLGFLLIIIGIICATLVIVYSLVNIMGKSNAAKILQYGKERDYFIYEMLSSAFVGGSVLRNLYFPVIQNEKKEVRKADIVCVTRGGIAVIEVKGNSGRISCPPTDTWTQRIGKKTEQFPNPHKKNEENVKAIRTALAKKGLSNVPIHNYVVFADTDTVFSHRYPWLLRSDNLVATLERLDDKLILTRRDQRIIAQIMKNHRRRPSPKRKHNRQNAGGRRK